MKFHKLLHLFMFVALVSSNLFCNKEQGPQGFNSIIRTTAETAGTNCSNGGYKVESGIDKNNNDILEDFEVTNTSYICNGIDSNEPATLINVSAEPNGDNCSSGGYRIETGTDVNKDGELQASEVTKTTFICSKALSYYAILNQSNTEAPQSTIVENSLELTINWTRISAGKYLGTLSRSIDLEKSIILSTNHQYVKCQFQNDHEILLMNEMGVNFFADGFSNYSLSIKVFN
ncbi:hypothetical protein [Chitinophaga sp. XS-30]|uniref:DUF7151 family protein n=1 Tax=Chitinophaga sp. XS-30 TaxID=2604421 RepID=UPI0011DC7DB5|nr:hypothetical protein [Chitinophaga sp. XS-30]QEH42764.1 hypothetical protein FW415_18555 [Chitinophaga sp. XS-30]